MNGIDITTLPDDDWGPVHQARQSQYVWGLCERCGGQIASGELRTVRAWKSGPAELTQHVVCPEPPAEVWCERCDQPSVQTVTTQSGSHALCHKHATDILWASGNGGK